MLIHPFDAAMEPGEWQQWLAATDRFGVFMVGNSEVAQAPIAVPTHFTFAGEELLLHLHHINPVWPHLEAAAEVRMVMIGDYSFIPSFARAKPEGPASDGVPTSYYTSVQFVCKPQIIDDPEAKAEILRAQLADMEPEGGYGEMAVDSGPYGRMLPLIRGLRLQVIRVEAKFKYDDHKSIEHRERVSEFLDERHTGLDAGAAAQQRRRLAEIGEWRTYREVESR